MTMRRLSLFAALVLVAAPVLAKDSIPTNWRNVVTDPDRERLRNLRQAWTDALAKARVAHAADIAAQGELFDADRALGKAKLPLGNYRCRVFKLGAKGPSNLNYVAYPAFTCRVDPEGAVTHFTKVDGSQRPDGRLFEDGGARQVFLGTLMVGDEARALDYGRDALRDMVGSVERIGPARWRMAMPYPKFESLLDVIEITPAP